MAGKRISPKWVQIHNFWFGELRGPSDFPFEKSSLWFSKDPQVDRVIAHHFEDIINKAAESGCDEWSGQSRGTLALILCFDQFPRNIYRNTPRAFAYDSRALQLAQQMVASGQDLELYPIERVFVYLPLEHSEDKGVQEQSLQAFEQLSSGLDAESRERFQPFVDYAVKHKEIIDRFGRFPHRNSILGRKSTTEELEFLKQPGSGF